MDVSYLPETLVDQNPWWKSPFTLDYRPRAVLPEVLKILDRRLGVALTGLRRVGKTTLLHQVVMHYLESGLDPRRAFYFSFDEFRNASFRELLREYERLTGIDLGNGPGLIAFDEVQKHPGWENELKALYDRFKDRVRFVVSGSESLFLRRGMKESLAGRLIDLRVEPLTFREYLLFRGTPVEPVPLHEAELRKQWPVYRRTLGLPQLCLGDPPDRDLVRRLVHEGIVERVLYRDLRQVVGNVDVDALETLLHLITEEPGQVLEVSALSRELGVARRTVANYLWYLEASFLIRKLYNYSASQRKAERRLKRYYPVLASVSLLFRDDSDARARVLEGVSVNGLGAQFFWLDRYKHEVDIVLPGRPPLPVEVKSGRVETRGLEAFLRRFHATHGYVITSEREETLQVRGVTIDMVPAYKYLLHPPVP